VALGQVRKILKELRLTPVIEADTAGSAEQVAAWNNPEDCAIASSLAAELFGLQIMRRNVEDAAHNTTRFYVASRAAAPHTADTKGLMTTFVFRVRNVPAALYKALGGFATNGVNMTKLESYMENGAFTATFFVADVDGRPEDPALGRALEELSFFSDHFDILGVFEADPFRRESGRG
jgi:prephenate dehydratase